MNETAGMLQARLDLIDRIRRVEHILAREEQARIAAQMMKGYSHELGNQIQILKLSAFELSRRLRDLPPDLAELLKEMTTAGDQASAVLMQMFAAARPPERDLVGPAVSQAVRTAVDLARPAVACHVELRIELDDTVQTFATSEELEAMVLAAVLDAALANRITLLLRERTIQNKRWVELVRVDDRQHLFDGELANMFEVHSLLHIVAGVAKQAGGDTSLSPGRAGLELVVELPVAVPKP